MLFLHDVDIFADIDVCYCLLPVFSLESKRFLPVMGNSILLALTALIIRSLGRVPFSGAMPVRPLAVPLRMVKGTKRF